MMDDLTAFVRARLDEDEAAAKAAADAVGSDWTQAYDEPEDYEFDAGYGWIASERRTHIVRAGDVTGAHIARHDPARVLREVAAKRAIVALHSLNVQKLDIPPFDAQTGEPRPDEYDVTCEICGWASDDPSSGCGTLRELAAVWSDHPGYRQEWKP